MDSCRRRGCFFPITGMPSSTGRLEVVGRARRYGNAASASGGGESVPGGSDCPTRRPAHPNMRNPEGSIRSELGRQKGRRVSEKPRLCATPLRLRARPHPYHEAREMLLPPRLRRLLRQCLIPQWAKGQRVDLRSTRGGRRPPLQPNEQAFLSPRIARCPDSRRPYANREKRNHEKLTSHIRQCGGELGEWCVGTAGTTQKTASNWLQRSAMIAVLTRQRGQSQHRL